MNKEQKREIETMSDKQYNDYLTEHINNVKKGFEWMLRKGIIQDNSGALARQIEHHDLSKYSDDEWNAYRDYFYANGSEDIFNIAWLHHIHNNPHHWQHWVLIQDDGKLEDDTKTIALPMPDKYIVEMICDWWAFSWSKGNLLEIFKWYNEHKNGILLHKDTEKTLLFLLERIKNAVEEQLRNGDNQ